MRVIIYTGRKLPQVAPLTITALSGVGTGGGPNGLFYDYLQWKQKQLEPKLKSQATIHPVHNGTNYVQCVPGGCQVAQCKKNKETIGWPANLPYLAVRHGLCLQYPPPGFY